MYSITSYVYVTNVDNDVLFYHKKISLTTVKNNYITYK